jgi:hypothetical protein
MSEKTAYFNEEKTAKAARELSPRAFKVLIQQTFGLHYGMKCDKTDSEYFYGIAELIEKGYLLKEFGGFKVINPIGYVD